MSTTLKMVLNERLYQRDPEQTELGRNIIKESIVLIDKLGFEHFTFKKLALQLNSTEASIYRYFENKHKLLVYLISWYWVWIDYQIDFQTNNIRSSEEKLKIIISIIAQYGLADNTFTYVNEKALYNIVVSESSKAFLTKEVDKDNEDGFFKEYKSLCHKIALIVSDISPAYPYPHALVSTLFEASKKQIFFAQHLPSLTEAKFDGANYSVINDFLKSLAFSSMNSFKV